MLIQRSTKGENGIVTNGFWCNAEKIVIASRRNGEERLFRSGLSCDCPGNTTLIFDFFGNLYFFSLISFGYQL